MTEVTLESAEEIVGGPAVDSLAAGLTGVGRHDAEDMGLATLAIGADDRGACAELDLGLFFTRSTLEPTESEFARRLEAINEATDAVVASREAVVGNEVLVNGLGTEVQVAVGLNHVSPGLALTLATDVWFAIGRRESDRLFDRARPCL
jgi:hypothetical protein